MSTSLLAFVHIEKAAGTTLIHILRRNFLLRHVDVRPLYRTSSPLFRPDDLQKILQINPFTTSIASHSLTPFSNLDSEFPHIRYITVLRDPVQRYVSNYYYWIRALGKRLTFEQYLKLDTVSNWQTKKISKHANIEEAKATLDQRFLIAGVVENFDLFLVLLKDKLLPYNFDPSYTQKNVSPASNNKLDVVTKYEDDILENNRLDIELYNFVTSQLIPRYISEHPGDPHREALNLHSDRKNLSIGAQFASYTDYLYRKTYIEPVTGYIRRRSGLPAFGSY